ncbi:MAG: SDR family NAD(P)-dependent oxidoreductase [Firmicutes bacterium]|nr:SDR family NAD(P)-dependent oxidoreductase [Bacillota bacterium]
MVCITGAAGGLGKAFAVECARRGWDLFLTDISETALNSLAVGLSNTYGIHVIYHPCDLTDTVARAELFQKMRQEEAHFRILINVAGVDFEGCFTARTPGQIRAILRLNIEATLEMTYMALELRGKGAPFRLITVSSLAAYYPMPVKAVYAASKRFLLDFSLALREEIRSLGGSVTVLCPAGLPTTESTIRGINAQGFLGRITTKNVGFVAARTIEYALRGKAVYIPGLLNRMLRLLGAIVPPTLAARFIGHRWNTAHQKKAFSEAAFSSNKSYQVSIT